MRRLIRSRLIWIYTVCKCVSEFTWCPNLPDFALLICDLVRTTKISFKDSVTFSEHPVYTTFIPVNKLICLLV